jgi:predicted DNA-binding transcriptional regulator AlpA
METREVTPASIRRPVRIGQLAKRLGYDVSTLWRWEQAGYLPPRHYLVPGGPPVFFEDEIEIWLASRPTRRKRSAAA